LNAAALKAGLVDNRGLELRKQYGDGYYTALVLDPDIEAVYRDA
jgi:hypothetical protein